MDRVILVESLHKAQVRYDRAVKAIDGQIGTTDWFIEDAIDNPNVSTAMITEFDQASDAVVVAEVALDEFDSSALLNRASR